MLIINVYSWQLWRVPSNLFGSVPFQFIPTRGKLRWSELWDSAMSTQIARRYLSAAAVAVATLLPTASSQAQYGPASMFHALIGEWSHTGTGAIGGYNIFV